MSFWIIFSRKDMELIKGVLVNDLDVELVELNL